MSFCWALCWAPLLVLLFAPRAYAQERANAQERASERTPVVLHSAGCANLAQAELRELIALELAPRMVIAEADALAGTPSAHATLRCDARAAHVSLQTAAQREHQVQLDFAEIQPAARPRLVALALSELLATADMEGQTTAPPRLAAAPPARSETPAQGGPVQRSLWLAAGLAREGRPRLLAPLGQLGFRLRLGRLPLAFDTALFGAAGQRTLRIGRVQAFSFGGALAVAYAPALGPVVLGLGAGVTLGYAALRGLGTEMAGRSVAGLVWGPTVLMNAVWSLSARWGLRAGIDLAYLLQSVEGSDPDGRRLFTFGGLSLHATLGVAVRI